VGLAYLMLFRFCALFGALFLLVPSAVHAESAAAQRAISVPLAPPSLSADCRSKRLPGDLFRRPLRALSRAIRANRPIKVLAIGSSSTVGIGASSPTATYVARLETSLGGLFKGLDVRVLGRGMSGEVAEGAADRMKAEVEAVRPDLVIWQVGTNDALRKVSIESLQKCLRTTLSWLAENRTEVVLIDPQYGEALVKDAHYERIVAAIAEVARESRVLLVDRFEAMRELHRQRGDHFYLTSDNLHMNDTGHRCMAEQLARSIVSGLLAADAEAAQPVFHP
jgi:acyl-CoA thioesterase I